MSFHPKKRHEREKLTALGCVVVWAMLFALAYGIMWLLAVTPVRGD